MTKKQFEQNNEVERMTGEIKCYGERLKDTVRRKESLKDFKSLEDMLKESE